MAAERIEIAEEMRPAWWPMVGVHAGLLTVAAGGVYTLQPPGFLDRMEYAGMALVGVALMLAAILTRRSTHGMVARGLLAVGGALLLYLAYDPQIVALTTAAALLESPVILYEPSLAHIGVVVAALFLALQAAVDRRLLPDRVEWRPAIVAAAALMLLLAAAMWLGLRNVYDLSGTASSLSLLAFRVVAYSLLMLVCVTSSGVRGVGVAPHIYFGLALIAAAARNMMVT